jgi:hypothetical protein
MKSLTTCTMVLTFSLCAPAVVYANDSAAHVHYYSHVYHRVAHAAIPNNATALFPAVVHQPETDGLSRDREDCNMGCIDNN